MKLFDKTIFRGKVLEIESLKKRLVGKDREIDKLIAESNNKSSIIVNLQEQLSETNKLASESIAKVMMENNKLKDKVEQKEKARRKFAGALGGLTKRNNELIAENTSFAYKLTELNKEFEEFKKNKFIVKEIKAQKVPKKTQTMGMRNGSKTSMIISKVKPTEKEESIVEI